MGEWKYPERPDTRWMTDRLEAKRIDDDYEVRLKKSIAELAIATEKHAVKMEKVYKDLADYKEKQDNRTWKNELEEGCLVFIASIMVGILIFALIGLAVSK